MIRWDHVTSSQHKGGLYGVPKGHENLGIGYMRPMGYPTVMIFFTCSLYGLQECQKAYHIPSKPED